jgi:hypothetical protein
MTFSLFGGVGIDAAFVADDIAGWSATPTTI